MRQVVGWFASSVVLLAVLTGCGPTPVGDPLAVMLDRDRDPVQRLAAAKQIGELTDLPDTPRVVTALHRVLWSDGQPTALRLWAMDRLIEYDPDAFWRIAQRRIREVDLWPVLEPLIDRSVLRGDSGFTAALVRSYTRGSQIYSDDLRPERRAIEALNPGLTVERAVWSVFVSEDDAVTMAACVDAWTLTHRLVGAEQARKMLMETDSQHPLILDLRSAGWLGVLPANREGVLWLMHVRDVEGGTYWARAKRLAGQLNESQRAGLELRHLPVLMVVDESAFGLDKSALLLRVGGRLSMVKGTRRTEPGIAMTLPGESLSGHADSLCFADLLTIERVLDALSDRSLVTALFIQADRDLADTATEHGGVLAQEVRRVAALGFPAKLRAHDQKFYSSDALIRRMYTGLAHYHFHAQQFRNAPYAGPGAGDLGFAQRLGANAVVFTFLDRDTLGVDYYQPGGVVVDLGTIKR
jgi:hypothetical protein